MQRGHEQIDARSALSAARAQFVDVDERGPEAMEVKERKPYRSLTRRREAERRYTSSSADSEEGKVPQKSYSSSETLKAYDQDARLAYGSRVKDMVPQEAEEFCRTGTNFTLRELGLGEMTPPHGTLYRTDIGLPHCGYSMGASSEADLEADTVLSPEHPVRLWGRSTRSGRSSCLSSRANSNLTLTDTEHENTETEKPRLQKEDGAKEGKTERQAIERILIEDISEHREALTARICRQIIYLQQHLADFSLWAMARLDWCWILRDQLCILSPAIVYPPLPLFQDGDHAASFWVLMRRFAS
ncbi:hypothetical protein ACRRTK_009685 [Alexandromys fortis]